MNDKQQMSLIMLIGCIVGFFILYFLLGRYVCYDEKEEQKEGLTQEESNKNFEDFFRWPGLK